MSNRTQIKESSWINRWFGCQLEECEGVKLWLPSETQAGGRVRGNRDANWTVSTVTVLKAEGDSGLF